MILNQHSYTAQFLFVLVLAAFSRSIGAADTAYVQIDASGYASPDDLHQISEYQAVEEETALNSTKWTAQVTNSSVTASIQSRGRLQIGAAAQAKKQLFWYDGGGAGGTVYYIDVITVNLPNAGPQTRSNLTFLFNSSGTMNQLQNEINHRVTFTQSSCIGYQGTSSCSEFLPANVVGAELPSPQGVIQPQSPSFSTISDLSGQTTSFNFTAKGVTTIQGSVAVIPVVVRANTTVDNYISDGKTVHSQGVVQMRLKLPPGATCTSRSGNAFGGLCPKGNQ